jgi:hypothetical protein
MQEVSYTVIAHTGSEPATTDSLTVAEALRLASSYPEDAVAIVSASGWRLTLEELEALAKA